MSRKKSVNSMAEARRILGHDFFEAVSDILPLVGPRIDMFQGDQELVIVAELPGLVSQEDVNLSLEGYNLAIKGELKRPYVTDEDKLLINERAGGAFERIVKIPPQCSLERIQADFFNGLLFVRIPFIHQHSTQNRESIQINFHS
ncbi:MULTISPECIES: Hsp20/alpha crystallin family protein [unclassified Bacillus (in: firmicutes)]|uniref:Hsp20/alpha crystallin family protein n=1 Tax=unclassified Bacillus (in: firmicutes) TaxID=185979 RepID=UPI001BEC703C|nr:MULTISPECIES: Hsp20/alpha crystallin family protein [unclassified Bacillus (in: firmicutes)]MBT2640578.1 Hsp20/alpha crystallin family protein [Bacillus sp. ISL-39]MBT2663478.1 Hsp20/alpha crystallin family protein [Bacillus sp. ISL-45]